VFSVLSRRRRTAHTSIGALPFTPSPVIVRLKVALDRLRGRLWFIPAIGVIAAGILAWALVAIDRSLADDVDGFFIFGGGPESARAILSTISAAMLTFTGLVFSITMLVLQLASSQLSPRVTRTFLRDRANQVVLAIFVATFVYALLVLREVRSVDEGVFVPAIAVWWAFVLLIASVGAFIYYIDHMAQAMRVETVIEQVATETREAIERCYPEPAGSQPPVDLPVADAADIVLAGDRPGTLQAIDRARLEAIATESLTCLEVVPVVGDFVPSGAPLVRVRGVGAVDHEAVRAALTVGSERSMEQDPAFGLRQLVDIAVRALSPGTNDPTTAAMAVDAIHDLLRRLGQRAIPGPQRPGSDGALRLMLPGRTWEDHVRLATDEVIDYGATSSQVVAAVRSLLDDLEMTVDDERRPIVRRQRDRLPASGAPTG
jgi:uncharacterized membrane protein